MSEGRGSVIPGPRGWTWTRLVFSLTAACGGRGYGGDPVRTVLDDAGRAVAVNGSAMRIVSTLPSVTELAIALGAADRRVARTAFDADLGIAHLPLLGRTITPGAERLLSYDPDLVIHRVEHGQAGLGTLEGSGCACTRRIRATSWISERLLSLRSMATSGVADCHLSGIGNGVIAPDRGCMDPFETADATRTVGNVQVRLVRVTVRLSRTRTFCWTSSPSRKMVARLVSLRRGAAGSFQT